MRRVSAATLTSMLMARAAAVFALAPFLVTNPLASLCSVWSDVDPRFILQTKVQAVIQSIAINEISDERLRIDWQCRGA